VPKESAADLVFEIGLGERKSLRWTGMRIGRWRLIGAIVAAQFFSEHPYNNNLIDRISRTPLTRVRPTGLDCLTNFIEVLSSFMNILKMKTAIVLLVLLGAQSVLTKIDMQIGSGGFGFGYGANSPAAQVPYSFVRLGPDTSPHIAREYFHFEHFGGYNAADHYLRAFSHMRLVGAGVMDMGILGVLPKLGSAKIPTIPDNGTVSFNKSTEEAVPGYYKVEIQDNITAELTTTQRTGVHRYTFKKKGVFNINFMAGYLLEKTAKRSSTTVRCGDDCLEGSILVLGGFGGRFGGYRVHYHLKWKSQTQTTDKIFLFDDSKIDAALKEAKGVWTGAVLQTTSPTLEIFVGISYVSIENARLNLKQEIPNLVWSSVRNDAFLIWERELSRFEISLNDPDDQTKFDTALYRTFLSPTLFNDVNGEYLSFKNDGSVNLVPDNMRAVYTDMSLWDVHRSQFPWLLFQDLQRFSDIANSIMLMNREGGFMPKWPFAQGWTGCMIGAHANTVLADWIIKEAASKGLVNVTEAMEYMLRNANTQTPHDARPDVKQYKERGYIAFED
jgi:predicted alpha-1,2-mannosidase